MDDAELVRQLRLPWFTHGCEWLQRKAADRIEALIAERDEARAAWEIEAATVKRFAERHERHLILGAEVRARAEKAEAELAVAVEALERIESITVHSGGEIHGVTAQHWRTGFDVAKDEAIIALAQIKGGRMMDKDEEIADLRAKLAVAVEALGDISNEEFYPMGIGIAPQPTRAAKKARAALAQINGDE